MAVDLTEVSDRQSPPGMRSRPIVRIFGSLEEVESLWTGFETQSDHYVFQTCEWCAVWLDTVGKNENAKPIIVVVQDEADHTIMLLPLYSKARKFVRKIACIGGLEADYQAPLISNDFCQRYDSEEQLGLIRHIVSLLPAHDILALERLPEFVGKQNNPLCLLQPERHFEDAYYAELSGDSDEFMRERCGAKTLQVLRRKRRKLEDAGELRFFIPESEADARAVLDALFVQKSAQYRATGAADILEKPGRRDFYTALALRGLNGGRSHLCSLKVGGKILAAHWGMIDGDRFYYLLPSHTSGELRKFSPGEILLVKLFEWCTERHISDFDFTIGDEAYKLRWSQYRLNLFSLALTSTIRGNCFKRISVLVRRTKLAVRHSALLWRVIGWARARRLIN